MSDLMDEIELTLLASGYVCGEWSAREVAAVVSSILEAPISKVRELHRNHDGCPDGFDDCIGVGLCRHCGQTWPCPTIRALDGAASLDGEQ